MKCSTRPNFTKLRLIQPSNQGYGIEAYKGIYGRKLFLCVFRAELIFTRLKPLRYRDLDQQRDQNASFNRLKNNQIVSGFHNIMMVSAELLESIAKSKSFFFF